MPRLFSSLLLSLLIGSSASAVTMDWTPIGNPGNACDPHVDAFLNPYCVGGVDHTYSISTYEVTNSQYAEFLNAVAASDPNGLYNPNMGSPPPVPTLVGGIVQSGASGSFTYSVVAGRENKPVTWVSLYDAMRFANWLHNDQPTGAQGASTTESGAYTITLQGTDPIPRSANATAFLPNKDEWYKAAVYDAVALSYFAFPTRSNVEPTCTTPGAAANTANCGGANSQETDFPPVGDYTDVGSYAGSASTYGVFDLAGNVEEWTEESHVVSGTRFYCRKGGSFTSLASSTAALSSSCTRTPGVDSSGFRVAMIPEPGTGLLVIAGLLGLAGWRRMRA